MKVTVPYGTKVNALVPTIAISEGATISPEGRTAQDFTNPVTYTVTAQDGTEQSWTITVEIEEAVTKPPSTYIPPTNNNTSGYIKQNLEKVKDIEDLKEILKDIKSVYIGQREPLIRQFIEKFLDIMDDLSELEFIQSVIDDMNDGEKKEEYQTRLHGKKMIYSKEYSDWDEYKESPQPKNKEWTVTFNYTLEENTIILGDDYITVVDEDGYRVEVEIEIVKDDVDNNGKTIKVKSLNNYQLGKRYYLIIGPKVKKKISRLGERVTLTKPIRLEFTIEN